MQVTVEFNGDNSATIVPYNAATTADAATTPNKATAAQQKPVAAKKAYITSSNGLGPDGTAFVINADTGETLQVLVDLQGFGHTPVVFDVEEFKKFYRRATIENDVIDVLDIGYVLSTGRRVPPCADYRANAASPDIEEAYIASEYGLETDDVAFTINAANGEVLRITVDTQNFGPIPAKFDVDEFKKFYGYPLTDDLLINVRSIGYTCYDGSYIPPCEDFRKIEKLDEYELLQKYIAAIEHLLP